MKNSLPALITPLSYGNSYSQRMRVALVSAFLLHLLLLILIPKIPEFKIPSTSREAALNVFLQKPDEAEEFAQELNQQNALENSEDLVSEPSLGAASPELGEDSLVSEESPSAESVSTENPDNESSGKDQVVNKPTRIITSWAALRKFTDLEVANLADAKPQELARFSRSFNSSRSTRRRANVQSYQNRYGDYYVRNSSSTGDICFKQEREIIPDELSTKTVYFFRCDDGPMELDIKTEG